jgi:hypothetical protein
MQQRFTRSLVAALLVVCGLTVAGARINVGPEYTRRMNLAINAWDVPSVNFLGAVDDGTGKWAKGFWHDSLHPNAAGHEELLRTFVPTLFEALEQGKPAPKRSTATGFARLEGDSRQVMFAPADSMHPFAFGVTVRGARSGYRGDPTHRQVGMPWRTSFAT